VKKQVARFLPPLQHWTDQWVSSIPTLTVWNLSGLLGLGMLSLVVMTWMPDSYYKMVSWPWILLWQGGFLAIGIYALLRVRQFKESFTLLGYGFDWAIGAMLLALMISALLSPYATIAAWNVLLVLFYGIGVYSLRNHLGPPSGLSHHRLWLGLTIVALLTSVACLVFWRPTAAMWLSDNFDEAIRNRFPFGHHNFTGGYLVLVLPLVLSFSVAHQGKARWWGVITSAMTLIALYSSGSRGAWLGMSVALLVSLGIGLIQSQGKQRLRVLGITGVALVVVMAMFLSNPRIRNLLYVAPASEQVNAPTTIVVVDYPTKERFHMARAAWNILHDRPLWGVGPGNMSRVFNLYRPIASGAGPEQAQQLHNMPLQILGELGLLGLAAYGFLGFCILRLWWQLYRTIDGDQVKDRWLLYGIGASLLGYSVSSLTDSQLENIGIATTLLSLLLMLIGLADTYQLSAAPPQISKQMRRILSLGVLGLLCAALQLWMPTDAALALSRQAVANTHRNNFTTADSQWAKAARLAPWDPTFSALAAEQILKIRDTVSSRTDQELLTQQAIDYYESALTATPLDAWFNNNLAVLYLDRDPQKAEKYASIAVQSYPRHYNYPYNLLGLTYLIQGKTNQAATAFRLEGLANPDFMFANAWTQDPLDSLRSTVISQVIADYDELLATTPPDDLAYGWLIEQAVLLRWWYQVPLPANLNITRTKPIVQILVAIDQSPPQARDLVETFLEQDPNHEAFKLLRAWIAPDQYLQTYLQGTTELSQEEKDMVENHILKYRNIRQWLKSTNDLPAFRFRNNMAFAYRNMQANLIELILRPDNVMGSGLAINVLQLFSPTPREFVTLDHLIERIRAENLGLPHPTYNHFTLTIPSEH
jgi:putative inorganic carbon (HCO3(-)) transporter